MIVATAGHVDHGKTTLIKALTGVDTMHLPEERRRGMTIDLGFAGLPLPNGQFIGFVDVPGHERFIRNMLSGITGVDLALLVVAADDGIKPQTREHLEILDLLNVQDAAIALTKIDRVDDARLAEVSSSIGPLLAPTSLAGAPVFAVSAARDIGISALREHLTARAAQASRHRHGAYFRLPVDRSFIREGAGLIVTGTIASGRVAVGDHLKLMPADKPIRVRGLHAHHSAVDRLGAGERCALQIVANDSDRARVGRGDWIVAPALAAATRQLDARLRSGAGVRLKDGARIIFCHGAAGVTGRLVLLSQDAGTQLVQIVLSAPVHALVKDAFILRDADGQRTLAGGTVLDPFPPTRGRRRADRIKTLTALDEPDVKDALMKLLPAANDGIDLDRFALAWNISEDTAKSLWESVGLARFESRGYDAAQWREGCEALLAEVARFHLEHPDNCGPSAEALRTNSSAGRQFQRAMLESLIQEKRLVREGAHIRAPMHKIEMSASEKVLWRKIAPLLGPNRRPMTMHDIATQENLELQTIKRVLQRAARAGYVVRIAAGRFLHKSTFIDLAAKAEILAENSKGRLFDAASFRDRTRLGRGISIELLEYFDRIGFTQRVGDQRRLLKPAAAIAEATALNPHRQHASIVAGENRTPVGRTDFKSGERREAPLAGPTPASPASSQGR
jgi:selenocysteine-specific elongation factor